MEMKFKVGDRVAVYDIGRETGEVIDITDDKYIEVKTKDGATFLCHEKQCRRLVKKKDKNKDEWKYKDYTRYQVGGIYIPSKEFTDLLFELKERLNNLEIALNQKTKPIVLHPLEKKPHKCPTCNGTGVRKWIEDPYVRLDEAKPCKSCDSKGVVWG